MADDLNYGTLDATAADEILVADISTRSLPITGQDNDKNDQETGNDDQENGTDVIVKENVDQSAAFVIRNENSNISESCESRVEPKSNTITSGDNKTMCNKNSAPQTDSKQTNRKQHFLKLISACRLFLAKPVFLENLQENHIDLLISTGAYNVVLNALKYSLSVALRHQAWPEAAVHRASSSFKHVMVFLDYIKFKAYSLDTGSFHEFADRPRDFSSGKHIIVFDNNLYFVYRSIDRHNIFSMMTKQKSWVPVADLNKYDSNNKLLAHGNYVYDVYVEKNQLTISRWSYAHGHSTWMTQTCHRHVYNNIIRFQLYIVVLLPTKDADNITAHCFNTETDNVHVHTTSMRGYPHFMISFSSNEDVYILSGGGSLWKVFSTDTTPVDFVLVTKLWDSFFTCHPRGCMLYKHKLYIFYNTFVGEKPITWLTSLPGIYEDIVMIRLYDDTQCLPMVMPGAWLTS